MAGTAESSQQPRPRAAPADVAGVLLGPLPPTVGFSVRCDPTEPLEVAKSVPQVAGHADGAGTTERAPGLALIVDLPSTLVAEFEMGVGPEPAPLRKPAVHIRGGGLGRQVVCRQERPTRAWRAGLIGHATGGVPGESELGGGFASRLSSFHRTLSCPLASVGRQNLVGRNNVRGPALVPD